MNIQTKLVLGILFPILVSFAVLGYWSVQTAARGIRQSAIRHMTLTLDAYVDDKVGELNDILVRNHLDKEVAFVKEYKATAMRAAGAVKIVTSGEIFGLDEDGKEVFKSAKPGAQEPLWEKIAVDMVKGAEEKRSGYVLAGNTGHVFAARHYKPWKWIIFYADSDKEVREGQESIRNATLLVAGFCLAMTILIVSLIFRVFFVRPINKLHDAAWAIARGESVTHVEIRTRDELGALSRNMESMSRAILEHRAEQLSWQELLEEKVAEQTAHLSKEIRDRKQAEKERAELEIRLRQKQRLASVGILAGGVAHEINNPVNGIMNYAQLINDRLGGDHPLKEFAREIISETDRITAIVYNLLAFARQEDREPSPANISDILESTLSLIRTIIRRDEIALELDIAEDLPAIICRSQQIRQVVMNLITNARDALNQKYPEGDDNKKVTISCRLIEKDGEKWIRTTVEDHGPGIDQETRERMFDPFFTTKPRDKGTGLGLSISYGIVKEHGGELHLESRVGEFARFHLDLPPDPGDKRLR